MKEKKYLQNGSAARLNYLQPCIHKMTFAGITKMFLHKIGCSNTVGLLPTRSNHGAIHALTEINAQCIYFPSVGSLLPLPPTCMKSELVKLRIQISWSEEQHCWFLNSVMLMRKRVCDWCMKSLRQFKCGWHVCMQPVVRRLSSHKKHASDPPCCTQVEWPAITGQKIYHIYCSQYAGPENRRNLNERAKEREMSCVNL